MSEAPVRRRTASHQVSAALLDAAEAVLDRDGTGGVTVRAVAQQAAVSPMSVYNRFESKDGLIVALATHTLAQLAEAIDAPNDIDPVERFRVACRTYRDFALRHPARYSLIFGVGSPLEDQSSEVASSGRAAGPSRRRRRCRAAGEGLPTTPPDVPDEWCGADLVPDRTRRPGSVAPGRRPRGRPAGTGRRSRRHVAALRPGTPCLR